MLESPNPGPNPNPTNTNTNTKWSNNQLQPVTAGLCKDWSISRLFGSALLRYGVMKYTTYQRQQLRAPPSSPIKLLGDQSVICIGVDQSSYRSYRSSTPELLTGTLTFLSLYSFYPFQDRLDSLGVVWRHTSASPPIGIKSYFPF